MENKEFDRHNLSKSEVVAIMPLACSNEDVAVEFFELQRWGDKPVCVWCQSVNVYKMTDAKTGKRNKRYLWRCRDCHKQYTVRIGMVWEETRLPLRHWCYAFWRASTSKKGVAALEIMRHCQITYRSALFLLNRIRFAMAPDASTPKLTGTVEADETYIGPKPRSGDGKEHKRGRGTSKTPVFCAVERNGSKHSRVVADVTSATLRDALREVVDQKARVITDDFASYTGLEHRFEGGHDTICHSTREYVRGDVHTNTVESSFALVKRGIHGIYHNVSKEYLHRYLWQFDFVWNNRSLNHGERTSAAIQSARGKRLMYRQPL
ncbi:MAG TPA: IS1595 family transposase [Terriglobia bacterium]|jgi:transposase-like protein|nr:IS1595 family transposase [Terriglobia bacterium]